MQCLGLQALHKIASIGARTKVLVVWHAVLAYDYDPGAMGQLTYAVSDPHFTVVQTAPGTQTVQVAMLVRALEYMIRTICSIYDCSFSSAASFLAEYDCLDLTEH